MTPSEGIFSFVQLHHTATVQEPDQPMIPKKNENRCTQAIHCTSLAVPQAYLENVKLQTKKLVIISWQVAEFCKRILQSPSKRYSMSKKLIVIPMMRLKQVIQVHAQTHIHISLCNKGPPE